MRHAWFWIRMVQSWKRIRCLALSKMKSSAQQTDRVFAGCSSDLLVADGVCDFWWFFLSSLVNASTCPSCTTTEYGLMRCLCTGPRGSPGRPCHGLHIHTCNPQPVTTKCCTLLVLYRHTAMTLKFTPHKRTASATLPGSNKLGHAVLPRRRWGGAFRPGQRRRPGCCC